MFWRKNCNSSNEKIIFKKRNKDAKLWKEYLRIS